MTKKYNLILGQDFKASSAFGDKIYCAYAKCKNSYVIRYDRKWQITIEKQYQFTQEQINDLKYSLHNKAMCKIVDLAKVEIKEPLYYMQSKRTNPDGYKLFFTLFKDDSHLEDISAFPDNSFEDFLEHIDGIARAHSLLSKEEWEPYLTPDKELVEYEPEDSKDEQKV